MPDHGLPRRSQAPMPREACDSTPLHAPKGAPISAPTSAPTGVPISASTSVPTSTSTSTSISGPIGGEPAPKAHGLHHGGRLIAAARQYRIPLPDWLDLSTGINPRGFPVPPLPAACWQRLPEEGDGLEEAAAAYYGNPRLLPLPGSQAAIQGLPGLFPPAAVACLAPLYAEHPQAWSRAGHKVRLLQKANLTRALAAATPTVLLCNPNNPSAERHPREAVLDAALQLRRRGGWLVVDEAFADADPEISVTPFAGGPEAPNLVVLRSLGKFFGLAGARVGFIFGTPDLLHALAEKIGPWAVPGPSRAAARLAFQDTAWQETARRELPALSRRLQELLAPLGPVAATALFATVSTDKAKPLFGFLARRGILVRQFDLQPFLRFGLPGDETGWQRLAAALGEWRTRTDTATKEACPLPNERPESSPPDRVPGSPS